MAKPAKHALTVLASPELRVEKDDVKKLGDAIVREFSAIRQIERESAARFVLLGLMLHRLKASLARGKFTPFLESKLTQGKNWTPATAVKNASFAMRLATEFIERSKVSKPDMLSLPGDQLTLDVVDSHPARKFLRKLADFVGDLTRTELLIKHGITGVGLKTALDAEIAAEGGDSELTPEQLQLQLTESAWLDVWNPVQELRNNLIDPNKLQLLTDAEKLEQLKAEIVESTKLLTARLTALRASKK